MWEIGATFSKISLHISWEVKVVEELEGSEFKGYVILATDMQPLEVICITTCCQRCGRRIKNKIRLTSVNS